MAAESDRTNPAGAWAAQYARSRFGHETTLRQSTATVGTTASEILQSNPRRLAWAIFDLGTTQLSLGFDSAANATNGFPVQSLGGGVSAQVDEDGELVTHSVFGLSTVAGQTVVFVEVVGV